MADPTAPASTPEIPDKLYFRIGEVSKLAGIKPYVLRFWESEFPALGPKKSGTGHRLYKRKDVELIFQIKQLLYEKRYTIEGARKFLGGRSPGEPPRNGEAKPKTPPQTELFVSPAVLEEIRNELNEILALLR